MKASTAEPQGDLGLPAAGIINLTESTCLLRPSTDVMQQLGFLINILADRWSLCQDKMLEKNAFMGYHIVTALLLPKALIKNERTLLKDEKILCTQHTSQIFNICLSQKFLQCLSYDPHLRTPSALHHLSHFSLHSQ